MVAIPPTKPRLWFEEVQKILGQSVDQISRYMDFNLFFTLSLVLENAILGV